MSLSESLSMDLDLATIYVLCSSSLLKVKQNPCSHKYAVMQLPKRWHTGKLILTCSLDANGFLFQSQENLS